MDQTMKILVVGSESDLLPEFEAALDGAGANYAVVYSASSMEHALEIAATRAPNVVCVQMDDAFWPLERFARELHRVAADAALAAVYSTNHHRGSSLDGEVLISLLRAGVRDFLRRPLSSVDLRDFLDRLRQPRASGNRPPGALVTFISNRGGVGKSTLSVNSACELARRHPGDVLLVDASLQLGICSLMLDLQPQTCIVDAVRERDRLDESLLKRLAIAHPCGLHLLAAPPDAVSAAEVDDASMSRLLGLARRAYSYVVVDTFPMLDSTVMAILDTADLAFLVFQGAAPSVYGAARLVPILEGIGFPAENLRLILNRNHAPYPGELREKDVASRLPKPVDYATPYQKRLLMAMNNGEPHILRATKLFGFGKVVSSIVDEVEAIRPDSREVADPQLLRKAAV